MLLEEQKINANDIANVFVKHVLQHATNRIE